MSIQVPPFPGTDNSITLEEAVFMTQTYRGNNEKILDPQYQDKMILPFSETFNREAFDKLLGQAGCEGIRLYYGMDDKLQVHIIAVAVNDRNEDMLDGSNSILVENGVRCPIACPPPSILNS